MKKRTNSEIYNSCINLMQINNFNDYDLDSFKSEADYALSVLPERYRDWLKRRERYYRTHYRLGNEIFTIRKKSENMDGIHYGYSNIYDAYDRPSFNKIRIWEHWCNELSQFSASIYIPSRNGFQFTIGGELVLPTTGEIVPYYITKTRQEIYI